MWKRVRSEKQHSMQHGTYKAYVSFCFNGVVPNNWISDKWNTFPQLFLPVKVSIVGG